MLVIPHGLELFPIYGCALNTLRNEAMNRSSLLTLAALALVAGVWMLAAGEGEEEQKEIASPEIAPSVIGGETIELPLYNEAATVVTEAEVRRDALKRPILSLQARSALNGEALTQTEATIRTRAKEAEAKTARTNTSRSRGVQRANEAPQKDVTSFSWASTNDTPQKKELSPSTINLAFGADGTSSTELDPGDWVVTFEAAVYVSQTRALSLKLGDEESLSVNLVRAAIVQGSVRDRFGRSQGGSKMLFIPPGVAYPRFSRELQNVFSTPIDRDGNITPISLPEDNYTIAYGNMGSPKLQTQARLKAGETNDLEVVFGGKSKVRFELDRSPEEKRRLEIRLEVQDVKKIQRDEERLSQDPQRAAKAKAKGRWKTADRTTIRDGVGEMFRVNPGKYRVTLFARPGEYSSSTILFLEADESVLVNIQLPNLLDRSGPRQNDPKTPREGPLNITIQRDPHSEEWKPDGIYWR